MERHLCSLAQNGDLDAMQSRLAGGVDVNEVNPLAVVVDGTALHWTLRGLGRQDNENTLAIVKELITRGADVHAVTRTGETPFHVRLPLEELRPFCRCCLQGRTGMLVINKADGQLIFRVLVNAVIFQPMKERWLFCTRRYD